MRHRVQVVKNLSKTIKKYTADDRRVEYLRRMRRLLEKKRLRDEFRVFAAKTRSEQMAERVKTKCLLDDVEPEYTVARVTSEQVLSEVVTVVESWPSATE